MLDRFHEEQSYLARSLAHGEVLRAVPVKRLLQTHAPKLRKALLGMRQWEILIPGGCKSPVHCRSTVDQAAREGNLGPIVAIDLDVKYFLLWLGGRRSVPLWAGSLPKAALWSSGSSRSQALHCP